MRGHDETEKEGEIEREIKKKEHGKRKGDGELEGIEVIRDDETQGRRGKKEVEGAAVVGREEREKEGHRGGEKEQRVGGGESLV